MKNFSRFFCKYHFDALGGFFRKRCHWFDYMILKFLTLIYTWQRHKSNLKLCYLLFLYVSNNFFFAMCHDGKLYWCSINRVFSCTHVNYFQFSGDWTTALYCFIWWIVPLNIIISPLKPDKLLFKVIFQDLWQGNCLEIKFHHILIHIFRLYLYHLHRMNQIMLRNQNIYALNFHWIFHTRSYFFFT